MTAKDNDHTDGLVPVARVSKLFGTGGEVAVNLYDTFPADWTPDEPLFAVIDALPVPLYSEKFERRGRSGAHVSFADIDTPERATEFLGTELYLYLTEETDLPEDHEAVYLEDLVGFAAHFADMPHVGTIVGFVESEHNPLFTLSVEGKEVFIPASFDFISEFHPDRREITFDLPEGLLELYL